MFNKTRARVRSFCKTTTMKTKKHAPEILVVAGIIATGAAIVTACKATRKVDKILDQHHEEMDKINKAVGKEYKDDEDGNKIKKYTKETGKMDKFCTYRDTTFRLVKNYAIPAGLFIVGMTCFVTSTVILKKREKAAVALFNGSLAAFNAYRSRVREAVGEEAEDKLYHDIHEVKCTKMNENGTTEEKTVRYTEHPHNVYTFKMNEQTCRFWEKDMQYNLALAKSIEKEIDERVFGPYGGEPIELNEALKKLGMLKSGAMMNIGWVPEKLGGKVNNVSFGLKKYTKPDELGGIDIMSCDEIMLEFNCEYIADKF